jgi:hypothetical protein
LLGIGRRISVLGWSQAKSEDPISKITKVKRAGGMAQMVESLPSKCMALSSNTSTVKKYLLF